MNRLLARLALLRRFGDLQRREPGLLAAVAGAIGLRLGVVIAICAVARLFEPGDAAVYEATGQPVFGHSVKHLVAACAAWPVLQTLRHWHTEPLRHNPRAAALTA
ncbi:MAG: hypothetical protein EOP79_05690 [Variovorax sp.]|nr:MAG: hypothetical protein EOP79_05690 [Variovorax sp.]